MKSTLNVEFSETGSLPQTIRFNPNGGGCIRVPIQELLRKFLMKRFGTRRLDAKIKVAPQMEEEARQCDPNLCS
jgi:hypothetical protein